MTNFTYICLVFFSMNKILKLFVAAYDGVVCVYEVNTVDGGECKQIGQNLLFNLSANNNNGAGGGGGDAAANAGTTHRNSVGMYFDLYNNC